MPTIASKIASMHRPSFCVSWVKHPESLEKIQAFRFGIFSKTFDTHFPHPSSGLDQDAYDAVCDHLVVTDAATNIVGYYRVITPDAANAIGRQYSESLFDLSPLQHLRSKLIEIDRSCIDPCHRGGTVILLLWKELFQFMTLRGYSHTVGCSSVSIADGGHNAARIYQWLQHQQKISRVHAIQPHSRFELPPVSDVKPVSWPPILKGYLSLNAKVCGPPAYDRVFHTADFLTMLDIKDLRPGFLHRFKR